MKTPEQVADGMKRVKKAIETFNKNFSGVMPDEIGIYCMIAIVKDKKVFIETVKYDTIELSLNVEPIEKKIILEKLSKKYSKKDKDNLKEQKKLIKKQIHDMVKKKTSELEKFQESKKK